MKKIFAFAVAGLMAAGSLAHAQNASALADQAAVMEQAQKLIGKVQDLSETVELQQKRISQLESELRELREAQGKNAAKPDSASRDDLRDLAKQVKEIDDKRAADKDLILTEIKKLATAPLIAPTSTSKPGNKKTSKPSSENASDNSATTPLPPSGNYEGFEHTVKSGETLSAIIQAYNKEQGLHNTISSVLKHPLNSKVKAEKLLVGQKVFIPAPAK